MTGKLIVLEGIDGSGTTTQAARLGAHFGARVHVTREPSDGPIGAEIRKILRGAHAPVDPAAVALLFAADRVDHLAREIAGKLDAGVHVVSDRYLMSSLVYQGYSVQYDWVLTINQLARQPDLTILLDVPVEVAGERRRARGEPDELFDAPEVQRIVAARYRAVATQLETDGERVVTIDGSPAAEVVFAAVRAAVESCIDSKEG